MSTGQLTWIRWLAVVPCALLATVIVQVGSEAVFRYVLVVSVGFESWTPWAAKTMASALMGSIFVSVAWSLAPDAKVLVSGLALGGIVVWGTVLILSPASQSSSTWLLAMASAGVFGGTLAFVLVRRFKLS